MMDMLPLNIRIIKEFQDKNIEQIVLELRFNSGGFDEASLSLAGYFTEKPYLAYQKQVFYKEQYSKNQRIMVQPQELFFEGKIYVLTSGFTISAGETFIRSLLANPEHQVTVIGEETAGFYSDAFSKTLPCGFFYTLSNERYSGVDGEYLEGKDLALDYILEHNITQR